MSDGGVAMIEARIASIRSRFEPPPISTASTQTTAPGGSGATGGSGTATAFADVLQSATPNTPAQRLPPGAFGSLDPPAELVAFGNGRIPPSALSEIGVGSHALHAPAATAFRRMSVAAKAAGIEIGVTDSYRSYDSQVDLARRKGLYSEGGLAATPGRSNHGWGLALDLDLDPAAQSWMREHGPEFGFVEDTPREPWHWGYRPMSA